MQATRIVNAHQRTLPRGSRALVAVVALLATLAVFTSSAAAATGDIGHEDASFSGASGSPSGSKPESKLWFNDGQWWSSLYDASAGGFRIFRLNRPSEQWVSTGTALDDRPDSRADTLWSGATGKLYVASHRFTENGTSTSTASAGRLYRYSYNASADTYSLDAGFPVVINSARTETLVIDRDTTGTLWATWTQDSQVFVNHSVGGNDAAWGTPYELPGAATLDDDDISSLIAFGGRIGVMWSNQADGHEYFATHVDGAGDSAWSTEVVPTGASPDDHINLKADASGRVFAAVKTSESAGAQPRTLLLARSVGGTWTSTIFGTVSNSHTRAIVELDEQDGVLHMLATCPQPPSSSGQSGGDICEKTSPVNGIAFSPGIGTAVIRDASSADMNNVSSTKQNVNGGTGLVVLATNDSTDAYWHADLSLGAAPPPTLAAAFGVDTNAGPTPLDVLFSDSSTGAPTSWSWNFGDGTTSSSRNPTHRYAVPGLYTVTLRVASATQSDTTSRVVNVTGVQILPDAGSDMESTRPTGSQSVLGAANRPLAATLHAKRLRHQRVQLVGIVSPLLPGTRVTLSRRASNGRWLYLRRAGVHVGPTSSSGHYNLVVKRGLTRATYRVTIRVLGTARRVSHTIVLAPRVRTQR